MNADELALIETFPTTLRHETERPYPQLLALLSQPPLSRLAKLSHPFAGGKNR